MRFMSSEENLTDHPRARYIMIGGFLGAGKTTAVGRLAQHLSDQGLRVGLITNDQGSGLVDTTMLRSRGFATAEIPGGCFCCRFQSLVEAAEQLTHANTPDVFIAEPVGSCTDLVATVSYPLRRIYGDRFEIAPLSVLVDPTRAMRVLGLDEGRRFSEKVTYIYLKQLEEADLMVINKIDSLEETQRKSLRTALEERFPTKKVLELSARSGAGLEDWFALMTSEKQGSADTMEVDYEVYAEGEALLGWLNATLELRSEEAWDGNAWMTQFAAHVQGQLEAQHHEIAHLKMTLSPEDGLGDLAVINLIRNDFVPELSQALPTDIHQAELIVNLRAEADPDALEAALRSALDAMNAGQGAINAALTHIEHFRPGKPEPTHRMEACP